MMRNKVLYGLGIVGTRFCFCGYTSILRFYVWRKQWRQCLEAMDIWKKAVDKLYSLKDSNLNKTVIKVVHTELYCLRECNRGLNMELMTLISHS